MLDTFWIFLDTGFWIFLDIFEYCWILLDTFWIRFGYFWIRGKHILDMHPFWIFLDTFGYSSIPLQRDARESKSIQKYPKNSFLDIFGYFWIFERTAAA